jgi:hypothetical protein
MSMLHIATILLTLSSSFSVAAIAALLRWAEVAKWLMLLANCAALLGALEVVFANELDGVGNWAFLFACGACGCGVVALRNLDRRLTRWIHRFVIYAGYTATFAAMGAAGLVLHARDTGGKLAAAAFVLIYIAGSLCIFVAKTLTVRCAQKTMPEYQASLGGDLRERG